MAYTLGVTNIVKGNGSDIGSGNTATLSLGVVTAGSVLFTTISYDNSGIPAQVTGVSGGGTWAQLGTQLDATNGQNVDSWYCVNATGGATTVTITFTGGESGELPAVGWAACEIKVPSTMVFDAGDATKAFATSSTTASNNKSNALTVAGSGELILAGYGGTGGVAPTLTAGTGFTLAVTEPGTAPSDGTAAIVFQSGAAGPITGTFTSNKATDRYTVQIAAFKVATHFIAPTTNVAATSTMGGKVTGTKHVFPATVAATSFVSSTKIDHVVPTTNISATSTVTGVNTPFLIHATSIVVGSLIHGIDQIIPTTNIFATSTVTGANTPFLIHATSTVGGTIKRVKKIITASVAATSTVSTSRLLILRAIKSATINASSAVSGGITDRTFIIPSSNVAATSTVAGLVGALRKSTFSTISATSTVAGKASVGRGVLPAQIAATSSMSGHVTGPRHAIPTTIAATSTVAGRVIALRSIKGQVAATSTVSGRVSGGRGLLFSNIAATSTVAATIKTLRHIGGIVAATSTVTGNIHMVRGITPATILATSHVFKQFDPISPLTTINAASLVTGSVQDQRSLHTAQITAASLVTGSIPGLKHVTTTQVSATSIVTGRIPAARRILTGQISATSTVTGKTVIRRSLKLAQIAATSTVAGSIGQNRQITPAVILAISTTSGLVKRQPGIAPSPILATSHVAGSVISLSGHIPLQTSNILATTIVSIEKLEPEAGTFLIRFRNALELLQTLILTDFIIHVDNRNFTPTSISVVNDGTNNLLRLQIDEMVIFPANSLSVSYTPSSTPLTDIYGHTAAAFNHFQLTNLMHP